MKPLTPEDFPEFFHELHQSQPYDWQCRLARQSAEGSWPEAIDLPTGSGKTSCLDIAVFALACQVDRPKKDRTAPRRIFFCVNRRVIVDEAHQRAVRIASKIAHADDSDGVLGRVAESLRNLSSQGKSMAPPLDVIELRGGIYRDNRWARSATQPTIVCSTIDQLGSRLLFRGYGVSPNAAPIHAALIAYDSLILLDEAHISRPFLQTLDFVERYLDSKKWAEEPVGVKPMIVVPMTATPPEGGGEANVLRLDSKDQANDGLRNRLLAEKMANLPAPVPDVAQAAVTHATELASAGPLAVGVIVNRVASAKAIYRDLRKTYGEQPEVVVELVIGSMRPIDRDRQAERLRKLIGPDRPPVTSQTSFIVATQCLEVGADYDFDALVTECASLDALRQRFGRLNRAGRDIIAKAVILAGEKDIKENGKLDDNKPLDPIYGNALSRTWNWLRERSQLVREESVAATTPKRGNPKQKTTVKEVHQVNFGINAFTAILQEHGENGRIPANLLAPSASKDAPVMLPAYVDFWCQTSPRPTPDPEVSLFIHGRESGEPDVQVCWRADLDGNCFNPKDWPDLVGLLPPTSAECMSVPISRARKWLTQVEDSEEALNESDLLGIGKPMDGDENKQAKRKPPKLDQHRIGVLWRGKNETQVIGSPDDLRPGDTLVLPESAGGWLELGHIPEPSSKTIDIAEIAFQSARDRAALRLHPSLRNRFPASEAFTRLLATIADPDLALPQAELRRILEQVASEVMPGHADLSDTCQNLANPRFGLLRENYPDERGVVLTTRRRLGTARAWFMPATDEGDDERSRTTRERPISLTDHTRHVLEETTRTVKDLPLDELESAYERAADWHDLGKADERFQAMLRRTDRTDAWLLTGLDTALLAKSDGLPQTPRQRQQARERAGLPEGFRHEMLSVQIIEQSDLSEKAGNQIDFILQLIASHHGHARPFAPIAVDEECPEVTVNGITITNDQRKACPPHRIDSGIAERFWALTRRYGWWGLAYLEAVLRLADQQASTDEDEGRFDPKVALAELAEVKS
jgi:CRISPR-associated endonuclease/helicase Cas3